MNTRLHYFALTYNEFNRDRSYCNKIIRIHQAQTHLILNIQCRMSHHTQAHIMNTYWALRHMPCNFIHHRDNILGDILHWYYLKYIQFNSGCIKMYWQICIRDNYQYHNQQPHILHLNQAGNLLNIENSNYLNCRRYNFQNYIRNLVEPSINNSYKPYSFLYKFGM